MSHKNKDSLKKQVSDILTDKLRIGQSKRAAKLDGTYTEGIYSYSTLRAYMDHAIRFVMWCKSAHHCKTVDACRAYVDEYLENRSNLSSYTIKLDAAALGKLYGCSTDEFVSTQPRLRANISRSRRTAVRDKHFSETNNEKLVVFCRSTGLRRHELAALRGDDWKEEDGVLYVHIRSGKGGKERYAKVIGNTDVVLEMMQGAGNGKVFSHIPVAADIHGYRREYATAYYKAIARPVDTLKPQEKYICRKDKRGVVYDRQAMLEVSRSLGHNRVDVIAGHYLD